MMSQTVADQKKLPCVGIISNDVVGKNMAGVGIRYWEFARCLGPYLPVKLIVPPVVPMESSPSSTDLPASLHVCHQVKDFQDLIESCDIIIASGIILFFYPFLTNLDKYLVIDMYDPHLLEDLPREASSDLSRQLNSHENYLSVFRAQFRTGDFFICAGEKQRDYWLGALSALGRVNPFTYQQDPTLRRLIDTVPFGLPNEPPVHTRSVLKGVFRTISADDKVIIWGGGIWNWFDAPSLIKAIPLVLQQQPQAKLFFMGINRPNPDIPKMKAVDETIALSRELGLFDRQVFFNDWVPYAERQNYLLDADIGVSLHLDHIETRFAFRTRLLDYLWAGLPIVATSGDTMGEALARQGLAHLVAPGDVEGVARTILRLLDDPTLRTDQATRFKQVAAQYRWEVAVQPLLEYCTDPYISPDKDYLGQRPFIFDTRQSWWAALAKGWRALRLGEGSSLLQQTRDFLRWKVNKYRRL